MSASVSPTLIFRSPPEEWCPTRSLEQGGDRERRAPPLNPHRSANERRGDKSGGVGDVTSYNWSQGGGVAPIVESRRSVRVAAAGMSSLPGPDRPSKSGLLTPGRSRVPSPAPVEWLARPRLQRT